MAAMARRCIACVLALALAGCLPAALAQDDFSIAFGPVSSSAKTNSRWQVSSQLVTPNNITIRGEGRTATVTYSTTVTRTDQGTTWTISGSFQVVASATAAGQVAFSGPRIALEGQLPVGSPSAYPATCPQLTVAPNASVTCSFSISTMISGLTGIRAQARRGNSLAFVSSSVSPVTLGPAAASEATCVSLSDSVTAGQATSGITPATSTNNPFTGLVQVCQTTTLTYSLVLGPFSPSLCGTYQIQNKPMLMSTAAGPVTQQLAAGRVALSLVGCATQDAFGGTMPTIRVVGVKPVRVLQYNWTVTSVTTPNNTDGLVVDYKSSRTVKHSVRVTRALQSSGIRLSGEVVISNTQILPYGIAGVRVAVYAAGATTNSDPILYANATCPLSTRGQVLVPMQLFQGRPGTVTCSFEFMEPSGDPAAVGGVQAQMRTLLASEFNLDSGAPTPYDLTAAAATITEQQLGACATMGALYLNTTSKRSSADPMVPTSITNGMPRLTGGFLPALPVCAEARSFDWDATYGPWNRMDSCGDFLSSPVFSLRPNTGNTSTLNVTNPTRVTVTGCNMVPEASARVTGYEAVRAYTWAAKAAVTPGSIGELQFTQQAGVDYNINFTRSSREAQQTAVGQVVFRNPFSKPIRLAAVTYRVVSPSNGAVLASGNVSCPATGANKTVTVPAAAAKGNQTVRGSLTCNMKVAVPGGAKGNLVLSFVTSANATGSLPAVPLVWTNVTSKVTGKCAEVYGYFHQTQPASMVLPLKVDGLMPPEKGKELKLCAPQGYAFRARFGPFPANGCRLQQALLYAGMRPDGAANFTQLSAPLNIRVVGCTGPLPTVRVATARPVNITRLTSWTIKRSTAAAGSLAMLYTGTSNIPTTVTFEKGTPRAVQRWQITGNVLLSNGNPSNDAEASAVRVTATPINRASGSTVKAVVVNATCPTKGGKILIPRAPAQVNCSYSLLVPDAGGWTVSAAATLPGGGRTDSKNTLPVAFSSARTSESGGCAMVKETLSWSGPGKLAAPKAVGKALPAKEQKICATTVYQYNLAVGPFSATSCGAYQLKSRISARAAGGVEAPRTSSRSTALQLQGCPP